MIGSCRRQLEIWASHASSTLVQGVVAELQLIKGVAPNMRASTTQHALVHLSWSHSYSPLKCGTTQFNPRHTHRMDLSMMPSLGSTWVCIAQNHLKHKKGRCQTSPIDVQNMLLSPIPHSPKTVLP